MKQTWQAFTQLLRDSLIWSNNATVSPAKIVIATLSFTVPIILGTYLHNIAVGAGMAIASYLIGTDPLPESIKEKLKALSIDIFSLALATYIGILFVSNDLETKAAFWFLVAGVALAGSFSKAMARLSSLFIVMLIIARNLGQHGADPAKSSILFLIGSVWIVLLILFLEPVIDYFTVTKTATPETKAVQDPQFKHLWHHWKNSLTHLSGWLYTIRLISCMIAAEICLYFWPNQHSYWIFLTIAIVVHRNPREALLRKIQRSLGTLVGIVLASFLLIWQPPTWLVIILIAVLAGARPVVKAKNYAAYCLLITPLVMLLLDLHQPPTLNVLADRLLAAFLGSAIAFVVGYYFWRKRMAQN